MRSLTAHLRSNHPGQMQEAVALGIQRTRQHTRNLSPCSFCNMEFRQTHLCPVTTQVAVLEMQVSTPEDPRHFICFICQFVAHDKFQLRQHLGKIHNFLCLTGFLPETAYQIRWLVHIVVLFIAAWRAFENISSMGIVINLMPIEPRLGMEMKTLWSNFGWDVLISFLLTGRCANDSLHIVNFAPRHSLKPAIWSAIFSISMVTLHKRLKHFNMFFNSDMLQGVAIACHQFVWSKQHINVLRSYNWAWCTTMETIFSPSLCPMIPVPMTEWILIFHCHVWTWFMIASRLVTLPFFNRIPLFVGPFVIDAYAVERKWHWLVLPRNTCYDITYKPVTQSPGTSLTVWFKWWYTESKMITCRHVIGVVITLYLLMPGPNMMIMWLNAQHSCILQLGLHFRYILCSMEIQQEDIPMQMLEVLGNMALDYGASNGHVMKKRRDQPPPPPSRNSLPDSDSKGANSSKMVMLMANPLLRHEHDGITVPEQLCALPVDEQGGHDCTPAPREHCLEDGPAAEPGRQTPSATSMSFPLENSDSKSHQAEGEQIGRPCLDLQHQISTGDADGRFKLGTMPANTWSWMGRNPAYPWQSCWPSWKWFTINWNNLHRWSGSTLYRAKPRMFQ